MYEINECSNQAVSVNLFVQSLFLETLFIEKSQRISTFYGELSQESSHHLILFITMNHFPHLSRHIYTVHSTYIMADYFLATKSDDLRHLHWSLTSVSGSRHVETMSSLKGQGNSSSSTSKIKQHNA